MITKGIVEEKIDKYTFKVRMPTLDAIAESQRGISKENLSIATLCTLPNSDCQVDIGDIVFIGFEDNDRSKPIILGHLFKQKLSNTYMDLKLNNLETKGQTKLNSNTYIGNIKPKEISKLSGIKDNIQDKFNYIEDNKLLSAALHNVSNSFDNPQITLNINFNNYSTYQYLKFDLIQYDAANTSILTNEYFKIKISNIPQSVNTYSLRMGTLCKILFYIEDTGIKIVGVSADPYGTTNLNIPTNQNLYVSNITATNN